MEEELELSPQNPEMLQYLWLGLSWLSVIYFWQEFQISIRDFHPSEVIIFYSNLCELGLSERSQ
jgi:hypothetical protein